MMFQQRGRVFLLTKFESKNYEEVSRQLNISVSAVKKHIIQANKFLKSNYP